MRQAIQSPDTHLDHNLVLCHTSFEGLMGLWKPLMKSLLWVTLSLYFLSAHLQKTSLIPLLICQCLLSLTQRQCEHKSEIHFSVIITAFWNIYVHVPFTYNSAFDRAKYYKRYFVLEYILKIISQPFYIWKTLVLF